METNITKTTPRQEVGTPQTVPNIEADILTQQEIEGNLLMDQDATIDPAMSTGEDSIMSDEVIEEIQSDINADAATSKQRPARKKLSGAGQKRYRWLILQGHEREEAYKLALQPFRAPPVKRNRSEDTTSPPNKAKKSKKIVEKKGGAVATGTASSGDAKNKPTTSGVPAAKLANPKPSYKDTLKGIRMGILPVNFPEVLLTSKQLEAVKDAVAKKILELKGSGTKPKFLGSSLKPGWILFTCEDKTTAEWLKSNVGELRPWEGADLRAVEDDKIPHAKVLAGFFPGSQELSTKTILDYVDTQNDDLKVSEWRVLSRSDEGPGSYLVLSIDHFSAEKLRKVDFQLSFIFNKIKLRPKSGLSRKGEGTTDPTPSPSTSNMAVSEGRKEAEASKKPPSTTEGHKPDPSPSTSGVGKEAGSGGNMKAADNKTLMNPVIPRTNKSKPHTHPKTGGQVKSGGTGRQMHKGNNKIPNSGGQSK